ncbi:MAG: hypothetical protein GY941_29375 [Planctomycetes bacterium]|nr:hypothetical protein [Planctomycetota bacterium]
MLKSDTLARKELLKEGTEVRYIVQRKVRARKWEEVRQKLLGSEKK